MSVTEEFRRDTEGFHKEVLDLLKRGRNLYRLPPLDEECRAGRVEFASDVDIALSLWLVDGRFLEKIPVVPGVLRTIGSLILAIGIVNKRLRSNSSDALGWDECDRDLPVLEAKLREMLEHLAPPAAVGGFASGSE